MIWTLLLVLVALTPRPWSASTWGSGGADGPVTQATLAVAACLVWPLFCWASALIALAVVARTRGRWALPALRMLRCAAPPVIGRFVAVAVGVSLLGGLSACATPEPVTASKQGVGAAVEGSAAPVEVSRTVLDQGAAAPLPVRPSGASAPSPGSKPRPPAASACPRTAVLDRRVAANRTVTASAGSHRANVRRRAPRAGGAAATDPVGAIDIDWPGSAGDIVVVRRGDSLWSIAAAHLPGNAPPRTVDAAWREWYATNRATVGADPDLIYPGQQLHAPTHEQTGDHR